MLNNDYLKAKSISITSFNSIIEFEDWKNKFPLYNILDVQISNSTIYIIYQQINNSN